MRKVKSYPKMRVHKNRWWLIITMCLAVLTLFKMGTSKCPKSDPGIFFSEGYIQQQTLNESGDTYSKNEGILFICYIHSLY